MAKSEMIRARIEPDLKGEVENILGQLGLTVTEAITLFYKQVKLNQGLPFLVRIPNATTIQTMQDTDAGLNLIESENIEEMFGKLNI